MPDVTPVYGWPVPVLTDDPNIPGDVTALGLAIEGTLSGAGTAPIGDSSNSAALTGSDISFTANQNKTIISVTLTLDHPQWVILSAKVGFVNQGAGANPLIAAYIDVDSTLTDQLGSGAQTMGSAGSLDRMQVTIPAHSVFLTAGSHTIRLRGDRDGTAATVNARAADTLNNAYKPTTLTIIV